MTGKENDYLPYDLENMSIPELEALLQQDFIASDGAAPDVDYIMAIVEVIQKKEQEKPDYQSMDAEKAWDEFQSVCGSNEGINSTCRSKDSKIKTEFSKPAAYVSRQKKSRALRKRFAVAVLVAALLAVTLIPVAGYANVLQMVIAYWTDDYFSFGPGNKNLDQNQSDLPFVVPKGFEDLWYAAEKNGIKNLAIPQYIPNGFQVADTSFDEYPLTEGFEFYIFYTKDDDYLGVSITNSNETSEVICEKDDNDVVPCELNGTEYYIFNNNGENISAIFYNGLEYVFRTTLSSAELKHIIDSMYKE